MTEQDKLDQANKSMELYRKTGDIEHFEDVARWLEFDEQKGA